MTSSTFFDTTLIFFPFATVSMGRRDDGRRSRKHVSWSPVIKAVYRPTSKHDSTRVSKQESVIEFNEKQSGLNRSVSGALVAHARRDTHSLLLTIRRDSHRDAQLLIDLPKREIRRVYDGTRSWNVVKDESAAQMQLNCRVESVTWKDDQKTRSTDARGFDVAWINGKRVLHVQAPKHTQKGKAGAMYRSSRTKAHRHRSKRMHTRTSKREKRKSRSKTTNTTKTKSRRTRR